MIKFFMAGLFILSMVFGCARTSNNPYTIVIDGSDLSEELSVRETRQLENIISTAVNTVTSRMGIEFRDTLNAFVFDDQPNEVGLNRIYLSRELSTDPNAVLFEVTHALAPYQATGMYLEGLAMMMPYMNHSASVRETYIKKKLGTDPQKLIPIESVLNDDSAFVILRQQKTNLVNYEAGIFLGFLVTEYGWEKLCELYSNRTKDFQAVYLKSLDQLEEQWLQTIFPSPSRDTTIINLR